MSDDEKTLLAAYEPLLQSYRDRAGGIFEYVFDEKKAREVVLGMGRLIVRPQTGTCDCEDPNCPHKGDISPLASFFLLRSLGDCLRPTRALDAINFESYVPTTINSPQEADQVIDTIEDATYYRFRMPHHWLAKEDKVRESLNRRIFEVIEGVELPENHQITRVCYLFNENPVVVNVEKDQRFIRCPFPIFLHYLVYVDVKILFEGAAGDVEFFLVGGSVPDYPHVEMPDVRIAKKFRYYNHMAEVWYRENLIIFDF